MNRGRGRGGFGFGRGGGKNNNNNKKQENESVTACIPSGIDWHSSEPPKGYVFGKGRGEEGFSTGIEKPVDDPLEILRNQQRARELAERKKNGGEQSDVSTILSAADAAAREEERQARIKALQQQSRHNNNNSNNKNQSSSSSSFASHQNNNNNNEQQILSAIPEVGKIMIDAPGERKELERQRQMEAAEDIALLLPSTNGALFETSGASGKSGGVSSREAMLEKLRNNNSSNASSTSSSKPNVSSQQVKSLLKGVTAASTEDNSDAIEEDGGVEFTLLDNGSSNNNMTNFDPVALQEYKRLIQNAINRDPKHSEFEYLRLAEADIIESGGDVLAGYNTILKGTRETGGHSSLLWLTAAKFSENFFNDTVKAKELVKTGLKKMMDVLMRQNDNNESDGNNNNNNKTLLIPRDPTAKTYPIMINFINYAIQLFGRSTTDDSNNNSGSIITTSASSASSSSVIVLDILRQAVMLAPLHDPFWAHLFKLEDPSQHREILTVAMKSLRESKLKIPVTLWVRLAKLEKKKTMMMVATSTMTTVEKENLIRVKKVTEAGLKDHPNSPALWLIQAVAIMQLEQQNANNNSQQDAASSSNQYYTTIQNCLRSAVESVFSSSTSSTKDSPSSSASSSLLPQFYRSWLSTCLELVYNKEEYNAAPATGNETSNNSVSVVSESFRKELNSTSSSWSSSSFLVVQIAIREFLKKIFFNNDNNNSTTKGEQINNNVLVMEALRQITENEIDLLVVSSSSNNNEEQSPIISNCTPSAIGSSSVLKNQLQLSNTIKKYYSVRRSPEDEPEILSRVLLSVFVYENLIELLDFSPPSGSSSSSLSSQPNSQHQFTLLRHLESVLRMIKINNNNNDDDDAPLLRRLLSSLLTKAPVSLISTSNGTRLFLNACSAVAMLFTTTENFRTEVLDKIIIPSDSFFAASSRSNIEEVLLIAKQAFGAGDGSKISSTNTNNSKIIKKEEDNDDDDKKLGDITTHQENEDGRIFNFYYTKAIEFSRILHQENATLHSAFDKLTSIEEDIKSFVKQASSSSVSSSPTSHVVHLTFRTQLLSSLRLAKWQISELLPTSNNNSSRSFEDLFDFIDITLDCCRLVLHSTLYLSRNDSSSSSFKSRAIIDEQIKLTEAKLTKAIDEKDALIRQNASTDKINACMIVIQRRTNTLCHLVAVRIYFEKDDVVNRIRILDRFAMSKAVWRRGAVASFSRPPRYSSSSSNSNGWLFSIDPLLLANSSSSPSSSSAPNNKKTLQQLLKNSFDDGCIFAKGGGSASSSSSSSMSITRPLLLFPPSSAIHFDGTSRGIPSLDLLLRLLIEITPSATNNNNNSGPSPKAAALKQQMTFVKEILLVSNNNTQLSSSVFPFPLLYLAASDLYENANKHERSVQEASKALDAAFELYSYKPSSTATVTTISASASSSSSTELYEKSSCFSFGSCDSLFGSTSSLEIVKEIICNNCLVSKMKKEKGIDQEEDVVVRSSSDDLGSIVARCLSAGF